MERTLSPSSTKHALEALHAGEGADDRIVDGPGRPPTGTTRNRGTSSLERLAAQDSSPAAFVLDLVERPIELERMPEALGLLDVHKVAHGYHARYHGLLGRIAAFKGLHEQAEQ